jgi:hypothetical protein
MRLWLFGIFSSGPRGDDMVNGFREMDARFPAHVFARDDQVNLIDLLGCLPFLMLS